MRRLAAPAVLLAVLLAAGCVYYPTVKDLGGVRIRPMNGHAVRQPTGLAVYMDLESTGKYGDALVAVLCDVAKAAQLVTATGVPVTRLEVPGVSVVRLQPESLYIVLSDLTRPVLAGDVLIVTLVFEKSGQIGAITRVD
jgi:copper(I)-binding protein